MATRLAFVGLLLCLPSTVAGQAGSTGTEQVSSTAVDFPTPAWPAFTLLGVTPTAIARPSTPRALAIAFLSVVRDGRSGGFPGNLALEVAPYWLFDHPDLTFAEHARPGLVQSMAQSLSLSVAAGQAMADDGAGVVEATDLAAGARAIIVSGRTGSSFDRVTRRMWLAHTRAHVLAALREALESLQGTLPPDVQQELDGLRQADVDLSRTQYDALLRDIEGELRGALIDTARRRLRDALDRLIQENAAAIERLSRELQRVGTKRVGVHLEAAGGAVVRAGDGSPVTLIRSGAWMTSGVTGERASLSGLARVFRERPHEGAVGRTLVDVGVKGTLSARGVSIGSEALMRAVRSGVGGSRPTWRILAMVDYRVSRDVSLNAAFGKDFTDAHIRRRNVVVGILGVNFLFGEPTDLLLR